MRRVLEDDGMPLPGLDVQLVVDTDAAPVVDAIERAALGAGIVLERVELEGSPA